MNQTVTQDRWQKLFAKPLLIFVLVSIGFALGRLTAPAPVASPAEPQDPSGGVSGPSRVVVSYLHGNIRCITCNTTERMLREVVQRRYGDALASELVVWREVNFDEDPTLAKRYDVETSMPVISWEVSGREDGFAKINDVWDLIRDAAAFEDAITNAIDDALEKLPAPALVAEPSKGDA